MTAEAPKHLTTYDEFRVDGRYALANTTEHHAPRSGSGAGAAVPVPVRFHRSSPNVVMSQHRNAHDTLRLTPQPPPARHLSRRASRCTCVMYRARSTTHRALRRLPVAAAELPLCAGCAARPSPPPAAEARCSAARVPRVPPPVPRGRSPRTYATAASAIAIVPSSGRSGGGGCVAPSYGPK